ncbi:hypothetical protein HOY82DRAFT_491984 [Tuber indicum]|nr:hypothetical protein HOY82DRAFT_491984 [Tuber indicum]
MSPSVDVGISTTTTGILDFRKPGTGLYPSLQILDNSHPKTAFDVSFFHTIPQPFYTSREIPTPCLIHPNSRAYPISLMAKKSLLHKYFSQNIGMLERAAGVPLKRPAIAHCPIMGQPYIDCHIVYRSHKQ